MMKRIILLFLIFPIGLLLSQEIEDNLLTNKILIGGDVGFTFTSSDYKDIGVGLMIRGVGEYYFYGNNNHRIGARVYGGYGRSTGSDNRFDPDGFSTHLYTIAAGGIYSVQISEAFAPYLFLGLKFLRFNPKDQDGNALPNNSTNEYDRNLVNITAEVGLKYKINDRLYGYSSLIPFSITNDYIDDRASGSAKDYIITLNFGLLYAFDTPWSTDLNSPEVNSLPEGIDPAEAELIETTSEMDEDLVESDVIKNSEKTESVIDKNESSLEAENLDKTLEKDSDTETVLEADMRADNANVIEELSHKLDIGKVYFDFGETEFGRMEYVELDRLYSIISDNDRSRWLITGYTDNKEPVQVHQSLGIQRAYFVLRYFMSKGLERERFEIVVKGEANPVGDNSTEEGRAKNRRVEVSRIK